ncbi:MAG TPA: hypothetical protein VH497_10095, partial [Vicinamibacterales bacterium]
MKHRRAFFAVLGVGLAFSAAPFAQENKKQSDAQKKEIQSVVKVVDGIAAGQPAPNDLALEWVHIDMLKAQGNKEYVPFTVAIDPTKVSGNVAIYWRVVAKGGSAEPAAAAPAGKKDDKDKDKDKDKKKSDYAYEDISFVPVSGQAPMRISRSFTVPAGTYDVFVVAKEPTPEKPPKNAPAPKMSVMKQEVVVPDFWNAGELNTSTV